MLYALAHPAALAVLLLSFVVGMTLHGWVQCLVADRLGDRRPRSELRLQPDPRRHLDPFGAVGAALSGLGWARPVELPDRRRRGAVLAVALSGPAVNLVLGVGLLLAWRFSYGPLPLGELPGAELVQKGLPRGFDPGVALVLAGLSQLFLGALSLVPLPPLDGGRLLFALGPRSLGWQRAQHYLVEQNIGVVAVLVLLLFPLGGSTPPLPALLQIVLRPLINVICGG